MKKTIKMKNSQTNTAYWTTMYRISYNYDMYSSLIMCKYYTLDIPYHHADPVQQQY